MFDQSDLPKICCIEECRNNAVVTVMVPQRTIQGWVWSLGPVCDICRDLLDAGVPKFKKEP
jgi:hypothetical protein